MLQLNTYTPEQRQQIRAQLGECAEAIGGLGALLGLAETIRNAQTPVLQNKTASFHYAQGKVSWDKVLFADKIDTLKKIIARHDTMENLLEKGSKKEQNTIRTLFPVTFTVTPETGMPYAFKAIDAPDPETARLNPLFELLFFASTGLIKKAIKDQ